MLQSILVYTTALALFMSGCAYCQQTATSQKSNFPLGTFYEIFVPSFFDSDNDSLGDVKGITLKLDYIKQAGFEAIVLSPLTWSLSITKNDVIDFSIVNPSLGNLADLKDLVTEAHKQNLKAIFSIDGSTTSLQHPWFTDVLSNNNSLYKDSYVIRTKSTHAKNKKDWHVLKPNAKNSNQEMYLSKTGSKLPMLNYNNAAVQKNMLNAFKIWIESTGADGIKFINSSEWYIDSVNSKLFWDFAFAELQKVKKGVLISVQTDATTNMISQTVSNQSLTFSLTDVGQLIRKSISDESDAGIANYFVEKNQWVYQQIRFIGINNVTESRFATTVNDAAKHACAISILLTLPGTPVLFYGDEIGLKGNVKDFHNVEPFLWQPDVKDDGRAFWITNNFNSELQTHSVALQANDGNSIYTTTRKLIFLRKNEEVLLKGIIKHSGLSNKNLVAFYREFNQRKILVLHNISKEKVIIEASSIPQLSHELLFSNSTLPVNKNTMELSGFSTQLYRVK